MQLLNIYLPTFPYNFFIHLFLSRLSIIPLTSSLLFIDTSFSLRLSSRDIFTNSILKRFKSAKAGTHNPIPQFELNTCCSFIRRPEYLLKFSILRSLFHRSTITTYMTTESVNYILFLKLDLINWYTNIYTKCLIK